jgi:hypothetical protein
VAGYPVQIKGEEKMKKGISIFTPLHPENSNDFSECMSRGEGAYRGSNFEESEKWFKRAVELKPDDSDARYGLARASMRMYNVNVIDVVMMMTGEKESEGENLIAGMDKEEVLDIYYGTTDAQNHVKHIIDEKCTSGKITPDDVYMDYTCVLALKSVALIYKTMDDLDKLTEGFSIEVTPSGLSITGWDDLTQAEQDALSQDIADLVDSAGAVVDLIVGDEESANAIKDFLNKLGNLS